MLGRVGREVGAAECLAGLVETTLHEVERHQFACGVAVVDRGDRVEGVVGGAPQPRRLRVAGPAQLPVRLPLHEQGLPLGWPPVGHRVQLAGEPEVVAPFPQDLGELRPGVAVAGRSRGGRGGPARPRASCPWDPGVDGAHFLDRRPIVPEPPGVQPDQQQDQRRVPGALAPAGAMPAGPVRGRRGGGRLGDDWGSVHCRVVRHGWLAGRSRGRGKSSDDVSAITFRGYPESCLSEPRRGAGHSRGASAPGMGTGSMEPFQSPVGAAEITEA